jgi:hypothetical protein
MSGDAEEPEPPARVVDLPGDRSMIASRTEERGDVYEGELVGSGNHDRGS